MDIETLKKYEGQWVSVVVRGVPRNAGGILYFAGKDTIGLSKVSDNIDGILISTEDITSILIRKQGENKYEQKESIR
jgi:hypothetical protein